MNSKRLPSLLKSITCLALFIAVMVLMALPGCNKSPDNLQAKQEESAINEAGEATDGSLDELETGEDPIDSQPPVLTVTPASGSNSLAGPEFKTAKMSRQKENYNLPASGTPEWDIRQIALLIAKETHLGSGSDSQQRK